MNSSTLYVVIPSSSPRPSLAEGAALGLGPAPLYGLGAAGFGSRFFALFPRLRAKAEPQAAAPDEVEVAAPAPPLACPSFMRLEVELLNSDAAREDVNEAPSCQLVRLRPPSSSLCLSCALERSSSSGEDSWSSSSSSSSTPSGSFTGSMSY